MEAVRTAEAGTKLGGIVTGFFRLVLHPGGEEAQAVVLGEAMGDAAHEIGGAIGGANGKA